MFARALIVLLLVLNGGVAIWWATRPSSLPPVPLAQPAGVSRLQLLREVPRPRPPPAVAAVVPAPVATPATPAAATHCLAFGPFTDSAALGNARTALQPQVLQLKIRPVPASSVHGWRVWLPPLPDRAAAQAAAARIKAAGFQDYYIVADGDEANSIALGRYGNEAAAQAHAAALQAAGFAAQAQALDAVPATQWIEVATTVAFDAERARKAIAAAQVRPLDCARLLH
ncbi:MAG TPA: SPOR domain-containing protein [Luteimonas sp.]|nr:SPOR domain-containing protein [Luteimonas sp.]